MYLLDIDPVKAAKALCDQDVLSYCAAASIYLKYNHRKNKKFVEHFYNELLDRVLYLPKSIKENHEREVLTGSTQEFSADLTPRIVALNRVDYIRTRSSYAEWSTSSCPGWVQRVANTILPERKRKDFLLRVQPNGPSNTNDARSVGIERENVRDRPMVEVINRDGVKLVLWE